MPDIFVSYSREDKARAQAIASALEAAGYDVFWDNEIPPGSTWADYLQTKITNAKALVVLWTAASTQSQWVREEARIGRDAKKLVPVILDGAAPPFGFGEVQAVDLSNWRGEPENPDFKRFLSGLAYVVQQSGAAPAAPRGPIQALHMPPAGATAGPGAAPSATPGAANAGGGLPKPLIYAGVGLAALVGVGLMAGQQGGAPAPSPSPVSPYSPGAASPSATLSPAVRAVVDQAQSKQREARSTAVEARANAPIGQQAAMAAANGQQGYGVQQGVGGGIAGDLMGLVSGRPSPVVMKLPQGEVAGLMQATSDSDYGVVGVAVMQGGLTAEGRWKYQGTRYSFIGAGAVVGQYSFEGDQKGDGPEGTGLAVIRYANGERYEGEYRTVGEGAQAKLFRHGVGAHYGANGDLLNAGRFENDRFVGPA